MKDFKKYFQTSEGEHEGYPYIRLDFDSVEDFTNLREVDPINKGTDSHSALMYYTTREHDSTSRYGVPSFKDLENAVRNGWEAGLAKMLDMVGQVGGDVVPVSIKRTLSWGDQGDEFDIHKAYAGGLDQAWSSRKRKARVASGGVIHIAINANMAAHDDSSIQFWRGAAAIRLADIAQEAGYQVKMSVYSGGFNVWKSKTKKDRFVMVTTIKDESMPMDMCSLATFVGLAGMFRHYGLIHQNSMPWKVNGHNGALWRTYRLAGADFDIAGVNSKESAINWVNESVQALNSRVTQI